MFVNKIKESFSDDSFDSLACCRGRDVERQGIFWSVLPFTSVVEFKIMELFRKTCTRGEYFDYFIDKYF